MIDPSISVISASVIKIKECETILLSDLEDTLQDINAVFESDT